MKNGKKYPDRPNKSEEKYVDFDEDTECWGIFGSDSGHCYRLYATEEEAEDSLDRGVR